MSSTIWVSWVECSPIKDKTSCSSLTSWPWCYPNRAQCGHTLHSQTRHTNSLSAWCSVHEPTAFFIYSSCFFYISFFALANRSWNLVDILFYGGRIPLRCSSSPPETELACEMNDAQVLDTFDSSATSELTYSTLFGVPTSCCCERNLVSDFWGVSETTKSCDSALNSALTVFWKPIWTEKSNHTFVKRDCLAVVYLQ